MAGNGVPKLDLSIVLPQMLERFELSSIFTTRSFAKLFFARPESNTWSVAGGICNSTQTFEMKNEENWKCSPGLSEGMLLTSKGDFRKKSRKLRDSDLVLV